jgi:hypothetical protein
VSLRLRFIAVAPLCCLVACGPLSVPADGETPPAPACPPPQVAQTGWRELGNAKVGISFKAPKRYYQKHWDVTVGNYIGATFRTSQFERLSFSVRPVEGRSLEQQKAIRQPDYQGYSECTETINAHRAIIQSYRGGGVIIGAGAPSVTYSIAGVCELRPGRVLVFLGSAPTRATQEEQLAVIRTLEFIR